jgi:hypothetical protein
VCQPPSHFQRGFPSLQTVTLTPTLQITRVEIITAIQVLRPRRPAQPPLATEYAPPCQALNLALWIAQVPCFRYHHKRR